MTITFSLAIYGATRFADMRREPHRTAETVGFAVLAAAGLASRRARSCWASS